MSPTVRTFHFRLIVSSTQTGVAHAALDWAFALGIDHRHGDVKSSDATLILAPGPLEGATLATYRVADRLGKPLHVADLSAAAIARSLQETKAWMTTTPIEVLNVVGPRESASPGIYTLARKFLESLSP